MARGINKVILVGNLGQDPEVRYLPSGGAVTNISIATTDTWKDKQTGQAQERTEWHRIVFFNRLAEIAGEYLRKGSQVYLEGRLQTRKWQDQSGNDRYTTEIVANEMQMLGGRQGGMDPSGYGSRPSTSEPQEQFHAATSERSPTSSSPQSNNSPSNAPVQSMDQFDDDIPF